MKGKAHEQCLGRCGGYSNRWDSRPVVAPEVGVGLVVLVSCTSVLNKILTQGRSSLRLRGENRRTLNFVRGRKMTET